MMKQEFILLAYTLNSCFSASRNGLSIETLLSLKSYIIFEFLNQIFFREENLSVNVTHYSSRLNSPYQQSLEIL